MTSDRMTNDTCPIKSRVRGGELAELWRFLHSIHKSATK